MNKLRRSGFTIVELLVVIGVVAILAAIIVVSYNGITRQAVEGGMKSDLRNAIAVLGLEKIGPSRSYPESIDGLVQASEDSAFEYTMGDSGKSYCVSITSAKLPGVGFYASSGNTAIASGVCDGHHDGVEGIWAKVVVGHNRTIGLTKDGAVYMWGSGSHGALGNGSLDNKNVPTAVDNSGVLEEKAVTDISTSGYSGNASCAVADGSLYCWGDSYFLPGTSNKANYQNALVPVSVGAGTIIEGKSIKSVQVGQYSICVLDNTGTVYCWGSGYYSNPVTVGGSLGGEVVVKISMTRTSLCVLTQSQKVFCGSAGNPDSSVNLTEVNTSLVEDGPIVGVAMGSYAGGCLYTQMNAYCWGSYNAGGNYHGYGCLESSTPKSLCPESIFSNKAVAGLSVGYLSSCGVFNGRVIEWGGVTFSGSGVEGLREVATIGGVSDVSCSAANITCAVSYGKLYCWSNGGDIHGQIGNGTNTGSVTPVRVTDPY